MALGRARNPRRGRGQWAARGDGRLCNASIWGVFSRCSLRLGRSHQNRHSHRPAECPCNRADVPVYGLPFGPTNSGRGSPAGRRSRMGMAVKSLMCPRRLKQNRPQSVIFQRAIAGCQVRTGVRQSIPSMSIDSCAGVSDTAPCLACGQTNLRRAWHTAPGLGHPKPGSSKDGLADPGRGTMPPLNGS